MLRLLLLPHVIHQLIYSWQLKVSLSLGMNMKDILEKVLLEPNLEIREEFNCVGKEGNGILV